VVGNPCHAVTQLARLLRVVIWQISAAHSTGEAIRSFAPALISANLKSRQWF